MISANFYVYIAVDPYGSFRVGLTNDLVLRILEHRRGDASNGASHLEPTRLVYYEVLTNLAAAVYREKQLMGWKRGRKKRRVSSVNPGWKDLLEAAKVG